MEVLGLGSKIMEVFIQRTITRITVMIMNAGIWQFHLKEPLLRESNILEVTQKPLKANSKFSLSLSLLMRKTGTFTIQEFSMIAKLLIYSIMQLPLLGILRIIGLFETLGLKDGEKMDT